MGEQDQQTRQRLLRCAKAEFLSRGFEHASLRRICGAAGVTTGAVYFFLPKQGGFVRPDRTGHCPTTDPAGT